MGSAAFHLAEAQAAHDRLAGGATALTILYAAQYAGIDRTEFFRAACWPSPPARARAIAVYILTTLFEFTNEAAGAAMGLDARNVQRAKGRVLEAREDDAALDRFLDDLASVIDGRRAA